MLQNIAKPYPPWKFHFPFQTFFQKIVCSTPWYETKVILTENDMARHKNILQ